MPTKAKSKANKNLSLYIKVSVALLVLIVAAMYVPFLINPFSADGYTINMYYGASYLVTALLGIAAFVFGVLGVRLGTKTHHIGLFVLTILIGAYSLFQALWVFCSLMKMH